MPFIGRGGQQDIVVPANQSIIVSSFGPGTTKVSYGYPTTGNLPLQFALQQILTNQVVTFGPLAAQQTVRIEAATGCEVEYAVGANPQLSTVNPADMPNLTMGSAQFIADSSAGGITAGTTRTQAGATALTQQNNRVDTSTAPASGSILGDGVKLPAPVAGYEIAVHNNTANNIQVYGNGAENINGIGGATGVSLPPGDAVVFFCFTVADGWRAELGVGTSGNLPTQLVNFGISAAGSTQGTATALVADINRVSTATANQGVKLPAAVAGLDIVVSNKSGVQITVYPNGTDTIDGGAASAGVTQMNSSVVFYFCTTAGVWETEGLASGYLGNGLQTSQGTDGISAAGTTQATATPLTGQINNVTTVAAGTGVNLPSSTGVGGGAALSIVVQNSGANTLIVYPAQGASDTINGQAAATGVQLLPGTVATFNCTTAGAWVVQPGSTKMAAYNASANTTGFTATAAQVSGGVASVDLGLTGTLAAGQTLTLPTVSSLVAALHTPVVGTSYRLRITNQQAAAFSWTVATNTGWTLAGTMTIAQQTWREFVLTVTAVGGSPAATLQSVATGTYS